MVLEHEIKSYEILSCTLNQCSFSLFIIFGTESKLNGKIYMDIITHTFFFFFSEDRTSDFLYWRVFNLYS